MKFCPACKTANKEKNIYCISCGKKLLLEPKDTASGSKKISGFKIFLIAFFSFLAVCFITFGSIFIFSDILDSKEVSYEEQDQSNKPSALGKKPLSPDQEKLISVFGYPDEFIIIFNHGGDVSRIETWVYEAMKSYFTFEDGIYIEGDRFVTAEFKDDSYDVTPQDFIEGMTPIQVEQLLGETGIKIRDSETGFMVLAFGQGIISCTFDSGNNLLNVARLRESFNDQKN